MSELNKILYIEDDEIIAEVAVMILEDIGGFQVKHCLSGEEAINEIMSYKPELVLLDMMMPNMDGLETLSKIHSIPDFKDIPCIFMTAKIQTNEKEKYIKKGAIGVISKPFDPNNLCIIIREIWNKNNA